MTSGSEGGMIVTNNKKLATLARKFAGIGYKGLTASAGRTSLAASSYQNPDYERFDLIGLNYRMNQITAALGLAQLERIEFLVQRRMKIGEMFLKAIKNCNWLISQEVPSFSVIIGSLVIILAGIFIAYRENKIENEIYLNKENYKHLIDEDEFKVNIIKDLPDKFTSKTTTSLKWKSDFIDYFRDEKFKKMKILEVGSSLGHSTRILSFLFNKVIACLLYTSPSPRDS